MIMKALHIAPSIVSLPADSVVLLLTEAEVAGPWLDGIRGRVPSEEVAHSWAFLYVPDNVRHFLPRSRRSICNSTIWFGLNGKNTTGFIPLFSITSV